MAGYHTPFNSFVLETVTDSKAFAVASTVAMALYWQDSKSFDSNARVICYIETLGRFVELLIFRVPVESTTFGGGDTFIT